MRSALCHMQFCFFSVPLLFPYLDLSMMRRKWPQYKSVTCGEGLFASEKLHLESKFDMRFHTWSGLYQPMKLLRSQMIRYLLQSGYSSQITYDEQRCLVLDRGYHWIPIQTVAILRLWPTADKAIQALSLRNTQIVPDIRSRFFLSKQQLDMFFVVYSTRLLTTHLKGLDWYVFAAHCYIQLRLFQ